MVRRRFWKDFALGAAVGASGGLGSWLVSRALRGRQHSDVVRLEKSIQIARPREAVFRAWTNFEQLPSLLRNIEDLQVRGKRSHWVVRVDGRRIEWDAEITQRVDSEALGWKSLSGPKHTGRIHFSPLGNDTEIHVILNYAPPGGPLARAVAEETGRIEQAVERALRDFKADARRQRTGKQDGGKGSRKEIPDRSTGRDPRKRDVWPQRSPRRRAAEGDRLLEDCSFANHRNCHSAGARTKITDAA